MQAPVRVFRNVRIRIPGRAERRPDRPGAGAAPTPEPAAARALIPRVIGRSVRGDGATLRRTVADRLGISPRDTVLEAGCGDGRLLLDLVARTPRGLVVGVEPDPWMVRHATARIRRWIERGRARVVSGDTADLSAFPDGFFDKACAVDVVYFWHTPERDLAEIRRVLRPGGRLLLGYVSPGAVPGQAAADIVRCTGEVEGWLRAAGFVDVATTEGARSPAQGALSWTHAVTPDGPASG
jgi:SAM-dependent methyltransferase